MVYLDIFKKYQKIIVLLDCNVNVLLFFFVFQISFPMYYTSYNTNDTAIDTVKLDYVFKQRDTANKDTPQIKLIILQFCIKPCRFCP